MQQKGRNKRMKDKDIQLLGRMHLLKVSGIYKNLNCLYEQREELKNRSEYEITYGMPAARGYMSESKQAKRCELLDQLEHTIKKKEAILNNEIKQIKTIRDGNILLMVYIDKKSYKEIGELLNLPKTTVHNRQKKALQNYFWKYLDREQ